jgi:serine/threonine-protein kinase
LRASPGASECLSSRVRLDERSGACSDLDSDARRLVAIRPDSTVGRDGLANALAEQGAPIEVVRDAIGAFDDRYWWTLRATFVPMLEGNFLDVERIADPAMKSAVAKKDGAAFGPSVQTLIDAYTESGDTAAAARVGEAALAGAQYLCEDRNWCLDTEAAAISAILRAGGLTRSQAESQLLDRYRRYARIEGHWGAWLYIYGENVRSPTDAAVALTAYEQEVPPSDWASTSITLASAYMLAGRPAEARAIFQKTGGACTLATETRATMTERLLRGRLDEQDGNKPSACSHYAKILEHWGHAKPRSVTADEARARSKALDCPSP